MISAEAAPVAAQTAISTYSDSRPFCRTARGREPLRAQTRVIVPCCAEPGLVLEPDLDLLVRVLGGDRLDLLDDDLLEELLDLGVGVLVLGPGHQVAVAEAMEQVVDGLAAHQHAELLLQDPADVGAPEGTDAVLGRGRGVEPLPEPGIVLRGQARAAVRAGAARGAPRGRRGCTGRPSS